jgi:NAD(P)-dependent dehydrogenase (short-subunit alcohol dehydrogenase family)
MSAQKNERSGIEGARILVVGASASIGRALAKKAIEDGAKVVGASRRMERLEDLVREAGGGSAVAVDVREPESCDSLMSRAAELLGGIDAVCYTAGYAPLRMMNDMSAGDWSDVFATNVTGANHLIAAASAHLAQDAVFMVLSSEAVGRPRSGLGAYGASKAALEESLNAWRGEHPEIRFCCASIGATWPTEFGDHFDPDLLTWAISDWVAKGLFQERFMATDELARVLLDILATLLRRPGIGLEHMVIRSPTTITSSPELPVDGH